MSNSEVVNDVVEVLILLFHFLVVRAALIGSPATQEVSHRLKDFIHPAHVLVLKMAVVYLQEPVIFAFLLGVPVAGLPTRLDDLPSACSLLASDGLGLLGPLLLQFAVGIHPFVHLRGLNLVLLVLFH